MDYYPFAMDYLPEEMILKAEKELGETDEVRQRSVKELRSLVESEDIYVGKSDKLLLQYLRFRKFNVQRAFSSIMAYCREKKAFPELAEYDFEGFKTSVSSKMFTILPYRESDGSPIYIFDLEQWSPERDFSSLCRDIITVELFCIDDDASQVCGIRAIADCRKFTINQVARFSPKYLRLLARGIRNLLPVRFKGIHFIFSSTVLYYFLNIMKFPLTAKLRERIHTHLNDVEELHEFISPDILPTEYGGKLTIDNSDMLKKIDAFHECYDDLFKFGFKS